LEPVVIKMHPLRAEEAEVEPDGRRARAAVEAEEDGALRGIGVVLEVVDVEVGDLLVSDFEHLGGGPGRVSRLLLAEGAGELLGRLLLLYLGRLLLVLGGLVLAFALAFVLGHAREGRARGSVDPGIRLPPPLRSHHEPIADDRRPGGGPAQPAPSSHRPGPLRAGAPPGDAAGRPGGGRGGAPGRRPRGQGPPPNRLGGGGPREEGSQPGRPIPSSPTRGDRLVVPPDAEVGLVHAGGWADPDLRPARFGSGVGARRGDRARARPPRSAGPRPRLRGVGGALSAHRARHWLSDGFGAAGRRPRRHASAGFSGMTTAITR